MFIQCQKNDKKIISEKHFIKIYTQLYIIKEMSIEKESQLVLINDLLKQHNITINDIRQTVDHYNENPEKWLKLVDKIRTHIKELDKEKREKN